MKEMSLRHCMSFDFFVSFFFGGGEIYYLLHIALGHIYTLDLDFGWIWIFTG